MMDVLRFIGLVYKYRQVRVADPDRAEKIGAKIDKACEEYLATDMISMKDIKE